MQARNRCAECTSSADGPAGQQEQHEATGDPPHVPLPRACPSTWCPSSPRTPHPRISPHPPSPCPEHRAAPCYYPAPLGDLLHQALHHSPPLPRFYCAGGPRRNRSAAPRTRPSRSPPPAPRPPRLAPLYPRNPRPPRKPRAGRPALLPRFPHIAGPRPARPGYPAGSGTVDPGPTHQSTRVGWRRTGSRVRPTGPEYPARAQTPLASRSPPALLVGLPQRPTSPFALQPYALKLLCCRSAC